MTGHDAPAAPPVKYLTPADFAKREPFPLANLANTYTPRAKPVNPWQPFYEKKVTEVLSHASKNLSATNAKDFLRANAVFYRETVVKSGSSRLFFHVVAIFLGAGATMTWKNGR